MKKTPLKRKTPLKATKKPKKWAPRSRKCVACRQWFLPLRPLQVVCAKVSCAIEHGRQVEAKKRAKAHIEAKRKVRPRNQVLASAQAAFNAFIRERDRLQPCISCGKPANDAPDPVSGLYWDAGHFHTVGSHPELRFNEDNCHKQCKHCNHGASFGNTGSGINRRTVSEQYEANLPARIGQEAVDTLNGPHQAKHYNSIELDNMAKRYRAKTRVMQKRAAEQW